MKELPTNLKVKVYVYTDDYKYVQGKIIKTGQDEEDRWGDVSYWVELDTIPNKKFYCIYTKESVKARLSNELNIIKKDIKEKTYILNTIKQYLNNI